VEDNFLKDVIHYDCNPNKVTLPRPFHRDTYGANLYFPSQHIYHPGCLCSGIPRRSGSEFNDEPYPNRFLYRHLRLRPQRALADPAVCFCHRGADPQVRSTELLFFRVAGTAPCALINTSVRSSCTACLNRRHLNHAREELSAWQQARKKLFLKSLPDPVSWQQYMRQENKASAGSRSDDLEKGEQYELW